MCCSRVKKYCDKVGIDQKRTKNDVRSLGCSLDSYMVHLPLPRRHGLLIGAPLLLLWKILPLALLLTLLISWRLLRADLGIMPCASTLVTVPSYWNLCLVGCRRFRLHLALSLIGRTGGLILVIIVNLLQLLLVMILIALPSHPWTSCRCGDTLIRPNIDCQLRTGKLNLRLTPESVMI